MTTFVEDAIALWRTAYRKRRRLTMTLTLIFSLLIGAGVGFWAYRERQRNAELERRRQENLPYNQQLEALNNVQGSLANLIAFVELQKAKLKESEDLLNALRLEREQLGPVVQADRRTVEALLDLQAQRTAQGLSKERWIGFFLGVISSLFASFVISVAKNFIRRRRRTPPAPPARVEG